MDRGVKGREGRYLMRPSRHGTPDGTELLLDLFVDDLTDRSLCRRRTGRMSECVISYGDLRKKGKKRILQIGP
jgi:hypothetical protein